MVEQTEAEGQIRGDSAPRSGNQGLYRPEDERDSCGIGFVADIKGIPSHNIVERGLEVLERMEHRGAESADNKTGDGAGILIQIPHEFYAAQIPGLPERGTYGTGLIFLSGPPSDPAAEDLRIRCLRLVEDTARRTGLGVFAWRDVSVHSEVLGIMAAAAEPVIKQLVLVPISPTVPTGKAFNWNSASGGVSDLEIQLYIFRKRLEKALRADEALARSPVECYMPSLSSRTIVY
jgi:glutamate synthase (NADPH/NADH) large chain